MAKVGQAAFFSLYMLVFVDFFQLSFLFPLMPKIVEHFGGGAFEIGLLGATCAAGEGIAAPWLGALADKFGRRPVLVISMVGCAIATLVVAHSPSYRFLVVARFISGCCGSSMSVAAAYIADSTEQDERPRYMNNAMAALFMGLSFGPVAGGLLETVYSYHVTCYFAASLCVINVTFMLMCLPESPKAEETEQKGNICLRCLCPCGGLPARAFIIGAAQFLNGVGFTAFEAIGLLYLQDTLFDGDADEATIFWSLIISGVGVVGCVVTLFLYNRMFSFLQQRLPPGWAGLGPKPAMKVLIFVGGIFTSMSFLTMALARTKWLWFLCCMTFVFGENIMSTTVQSIVTMVVPSTAFGKALGLMTLCMNVARSLGPFVVGPIYGHGGREHGWVFWHAVPWFVNCFCKLGCMLLCLSVKIDAELASAPKDEEEPEVKLERVLSTSARQPGVLLAARQLNTLARVKSVGALGQSLQPVPVLTRARTVE